MSSINVTVKSGRLGKDPETKTLQSGQQVSSFSIAVTDYVKGESKTMWFNVVAWGKQSEFVEKYVKKGDFVIVNGKDTIREYTDNQGNKRFAYDIVANSIERVNTSGSTQPQHTEQAADIPAPSTEESDDLPF